MWDTMLMKSKSGIFLVLGGILGALSLWLFMWQQDDEADLEDHGIVVGNDAGETRRTGNERELLAKVGVIRGSLVDSRGEPVAGKLLFKISPPPGARGTLVQSRQEELLIGPDGKFTSSPLGYSLIDLLVRPESGANLKRRFLKLEGVDLDLGILVVQQGGHVSGSVLDEEGDPVGNARILIGVRGRRAGSQGVGVFMVGIDQDSAQESFTKEDGSFDIRDVATGRVVLIVTAPGFAPQTATNIVLEENGEETLEIELRRARTLNVEIREKGAGRLISGADIELDALDYEPGDQVLQEFNQIRRTTGKGGVAIVSGLARRRYRLRVFASGYIVPQDVIVGRDDTLVTIELRENGEIFGRVFDRQNGQSIGDFEVKTGYLRRRAKGQDFEIIVGEEAAKHFHQPLDKGIYGLRNGQYPSVRISIEASGFAGGSIEVEGLRPGEVRRADLGLVAESIIAGKILSHDYKPLDGAEVTATFNGDQGDEDDAAERALMTGNVASVDPLNGAVRFLPRQTTTVMTDEEGNFRLTGLSPGRYRLTASHPRQQDSTDAEYVLEARQHLKDIEIQLRPAGGVRGQVFDENGKTVPGAVVSVRTAAPSGIASGVAALALTEEVKSVNADQDGVFLLTGIKPGSYSLLATGSDLLQEGQSEALAVQVPIRIRPGVDLEKRMQLQSR